MKIKSFLTIMFIAGPLSACTWIDRPYLYGNESCGAGKTAYVFSSAKAAICLAEESVAYMLCARELGVIAENESSLLSGAVEPGSLPAAVGVNAALVTTLQKVYAQEGELAAARARAIDTCVKIFEDYR